MLDRLKRHRYAGHRPHRSGPGAGAVDDGGAGNGGPVTQAHRTNGAIAAFDAGAGDAFADADAARPRSFRVRHAHIDRIRLAVLRDPQRPGDIVDPQVGSRRRDLVAFHHACIETRHLPDCGDPPELDEPVRGTGEPESAGPPVAGALAGPAFQRGEHLVRHERQTGRVHARAKRADDPGGVPRGSAGELVALDQQHVVQAEPGEVVGDAEPDDAPADDDDSGAFPD